MNMKWNKQYGLSLKSATSSGENARKLGQQDTLWVYGIFIYPTGEYTMQAYIRYTQVTHYVQSWRNNANFILRSLVDFIILHEGSLSLVLLSPIWHNIIFSLYYVFYVLFQVYLTILSISTLSLLLAPFLWKLVLYTEHPSRVRQTSLTSVLPPTWGCPVMVGF